MDRLDRPGIANQTSPGDHQNFITGYPSITDARAFISRNQPLGNLDPLVKLTFDTHASCLIDSGCEQPILIQPRALPQIDPILIPHGTSILDCRLRRCSPGGDDRSGGD
jgi:hypothetical protein